MRAWGTPILQELFWVFNHVEDASHHRAMSSPHSLGHRRHVVVFAHVSSTIVVCASMYWMHVPFSKKLILVTPLLFWNCYLDLLRRIKKHRARHSKADECKALRIKCGELGKHTAK
jgi:hypothetical protein